MLIDLTVGELTLLNELLRSAIGAGPHVSFDYEKGEQWPSLRLLRKTELAERNAKIMQGEIWKIKRGGGENEQ